jgi:hypothetical protein
MMPALSAVIVSLEIAEAEFEFAKAAFPVL